MFTLWWWRCHDHWSMIISNMTCLSFKKKPSTFLPLLLFGNIPHLGIVKHFFLHCNLSLVPTKKRKTAEKCHPLWLCIWKTRWFEKKNIWKLILAKKHTYATIVSLHQVWQAISEDILKQNHTNATNASLPLLRQVIWENTCLTLEENHTNASNANMHLVSFLDGTEVCLAFLPLAWSLKV